MRRLDICFNLSNTAVDSFIKFRNKKQVEHDLYIRKNTNFSRQLKRKLQTFFPNISSKYIDIIIEKVLYLKTPCHGLITIDEHLECRILNIPILYLFNQGFKGVDVIVIHECIHQIESEGMYTGISMHNHRGTNVLLNEIRTQKLAIKMTRFFHNLGFFMYDNPLDYSLEGDSLYEYMFPLTFNFLSEYEMLISNCAIKNKCFELEKIFGEKWSDYNEYLETLFNSIVNYNTMGIHANWVIDNKAVQKSMALTKEFSFYSS